MAEQMTLEQELAKAGVPSNFTPVNRPPIVPGRPQQSGGSADGSTRYLQGTIPPGQQHDSTFVDTAYHSPNAPEVSLMPLAPSGIASVNSAVKSVIIENSTTPTPATTGGNMNFQGVWASGTSYSTDDVVLFNNSAYIALAANSGKEPDTSPTSWTLLSKNLNFRGQYQSQLVQAAFFTGGSGQTVTGTLPNSTAGNSFVVVVYGPSRSFATLTCTDSQGNSYTQETFNITNVQTLAVFFVSNIKGGANNLFTIACDNGHVIGNTRFVVYEILGPTTFGSATTSTTPSGGAASSATTYAATCSAGQMVVSYMGNVSGLAAQSLGMAVGFNFFPITSAGSSDLSAVNMAPAPSGGTITAGFNITTALTTVFAQETFSVNYTQNRYEPFDVVTYEGSTYVCVSSTSQTPAASNTSWYLLSQGQGFVQVLAANYTATVSDVGKTFVFSSAAAVLTLPATPPNQSWYIYVSNLNGSPSTISPNGALIDNSSANISLLQGASLMIVSDGLNYYTVRGTGAGGPVLLAEVSPSGTGTVSFTGIPATYKDLRIVVRGQGTQAATFTEYDVQLNGDGGANYDFNDNIIQNGTQSGTASVAQTHIFGGWVPAASGVAGASSGGEFTIYNYSDTTFQKSLLLFGMVKTANSSAGLFVHNTAGWWRSTAAVNRVDVILAAGNFVAGSVVSLWGIP